LLNNRLFQLVISDTWIKKLLPLQWIHMSQYSTKRNNTIQIKPVVKKKIINIIKHNYYYMKSESYNNAQLATLHSVYKI
jgi:hypothetical protein